MYIYLLGMLLCNKQDNVHSAGHYRKIKPFRVIQVLITLSGLFCDNDQLNAHYPLHKQCLPYLIYAASYAQHLLCTAKEVTLRGGRKGHGPRVSLRNYRHSNLLPLPALMTKTELPSRLSCLSSVHQTFRGVRTRGWEGRGGDMHNM